jgi:hypothetical protein
MIFSWTFRELIALIFSLQLYYTPEATIVGSALFFKENEIKKN